MSKKLCFYFVHDVRFMSGLPDSKVYSSSLDDAFEAARRLFLNGADSVCIDCLGEHDLK